MRKLEKHDVFFWLVAAAALIPWLFIAVPQSINADNLYLADALRRWLHGMTMTEGLYESNPPLCFLIYFPPVLLYEGLAVPLHYGIFVWTLALLIGWSAALFAILRRWDFIGPLEVRVLLASFMAANTFMFFTMFGERDQMIGMALVPFTMVQLALTFRWPCDKKLSWTVLGAGSVFILIKPHHGLLPALLILHRAVRQRRLSALWDPDVVCLAAATVLYAAGIFVFFPEYISQILPDAIRFYLPRKDMAAVVMLTLRYGAAACTLPAIAFILKKSPRPQRAFGAFLGFAALASLVPYVVQGHGYVYHLQPANTFLWMGIGLLTMMWLRDDSKLPLVSCVVAMAGIFDAAWAASVWHKPLPPSHAEYRNLPLVRMAADCGQPHCAVFIFNRSEEIGLRIAYYAGAEYASRFPSYWFLAQLLLDEDRLAKKQPADMTAEEFTAYRHKFAKMTAEDLARWKPQLALIGRFPVLVGAEPFDFPAWFGKDDPDFAREWAHYRKTGTVEAHYDDYLPDTLHDKGTVLTYDVWRRDGAP